MLITAGLIIGFARNDGDTSLHFLAIGSGIVTEFISGIFFFLYTLTVRQLKAYHDSLLVVQNILLAFKIIEDVQEPSNKAKMMSEMLTALIRLQTHEPFRS